MKRWRWLPGAVIALATYLLLHVVAEASDYETAVTSALVIGAVVIAFKILDRPEK